MKDRLRILLLSSEVTPFAKTGGLADVSSALPKVLFEMNHDVRIMMPKYGSISERKYTLREVIRLKQIPVVMGDRNIVVNAKSAFLPDSKVQIYFLGHKPYFDRQELYLDSKTGKDFPDNPQRFALFCRSALETIKLLHWEPHIIHCNDWQTALVPFLLKNDYHNDPLLNKVSTCFTIHNLAYQGNFPVSCLKEIGLPEKYAEQDSQLEFYGNINFLKAGISYADAITTVSPTYAQEIQNDPELGCGLEGVLKERTNDLYGILNGVDYSVWDPERDSLIAHNYSVNNLEAKEKNKVELLKQVGLPFEPNVPVIGMISRLVDQKGFDLVLEAMDKIIKKNVILIILGTGDKKYHQKFLELQKLYKKNLAVILRFDDQLAHAIEAGCDMFLMPSRYEPSGLNQMYSLRYGTIPIVRKTGGLADSVEDFTENPNKSTGFVFDTYETKTLLRALEAAVDAFKDKKTWQKLVKRAMKEDFSWQASAEKYVKLFQKIENTKRKR